MKDFLYPEKRYHEGKVGKIRKERREIGANGSGRGQVQVIELCVVVEVSETDLSCYEALKSQFLYNSAYNVASRISTKLIIPSAYILVGWNPLKICCSKSIFQIHSDQHLINVVGHHLPLSEPTCLAIQLQRSLTSQGLMTYDSDAACCQPKPQLLLFIFSHKPH